MLTGLPIAADRAALAQEFFRLLPHLKRRLQASVPPELRDEMASVTPHQLEALHHMCKATETDTACTGGATMNELARAQQCALSTMTALADRLIRQGLVERKPDASDRRVVHLVPTERGRELSRRFDETRRTISLEVLATFTDDELATFVTLVRKLAAPEEAHAEVEHD